MEAVKCCLLPVWNHAWLTYRTMMIQAQSRKLNATNAKSSAAAAEEKRYLLSYDESAKASLLDESRIGCFKEGTIIREDNSSSPVGGAMHTQSRDRSEMKRVFDLFDENRDGLICAEDLQRFMKRLGFEMSDEEVRGMVKTVDHNSDDCVDFEEFFSLYNSLCGEPTTPSSKTSASAAEEDAKEGALLEAFFVFDKNKDGLISAPELQEVLLSLGLADGKSLMSCKRMIDKVDADGNGQVDFFEFKVMMSSNAFQPQHM